MNFFQKIFKQRFAYLKNGDKVKEGDVVMFINSDGNECKRPIKMRNDGSLFFWNSDFDFTDYPNAVKL